MISATAINRFQPCRSVCPTSRATGFFLRTNERADHEDENRARRRYRSGRYTEMTEPVQVPGTAGHGDGVRRGHDSCHTVNMSAQPNDSAAGVTRVDIGYTARLDAALLAIVLVCV